MGSQRVRHDWATELNWASDWAGKSFSPVKGGFISCFWSDICFTIFFLNLWLVYLMVSFDEQTLILRKSNLLFYCICGSEIFAYSKILDIELWSILNSFCIWTESSGHSEFFSIEISSVPVTIVYKRLSCLHLINFSTWWKIDYICVGMFLDFLLCFINSSVYPTANIPLSWLS